MGLLLLYEAAVVFVVTVLSAVAAMKGIEVYKKEKRKKCYSPEALSIINDAALYYEELERCSPSIKGQDNIDFSILLAILNNSDLANVIGVFGIKIDSLKSAAYYQKIEGIAPENSTEDIKRRIEELITNEFSHFRSFDASMLFLSLDSQSKTVRDIIWNAMLIDDLGENSQVSSTGEKEAPIFYDHNYPEDNTVVTLTKKPTNQ